MTVVLPIQFDITILKYHFTFQIYRLYHNCKFDKFWQLHYIYWCVFIYDTRKIAFEMPGEILSILRKNYYTHVNDICFLG